MKKKEPKASHSDDTLAFALKRIAPYARIKGHFSERNLESEMFLKNQKLKEIYKQVMRF